MEESKNPNTANRLRRKKTQEAVLGISATEEEQDKITGKLQG